MKREYVECDDLPAVLRADESAPIPAGVAWIPVAHAYEAAPPQGRTLPGLDLDPISDLYVCDRSTLDVAIADLTALGGCERAIHRLRELRGGL